MSWFLAQMGQPSPLQPLPHPVLPPPPALPPEASWATLLQDPSIQAGLVLLGLCFGALFLRWLRRPRIRAALAGRNALDEALATLSQLLPLASTQPPAQTAAAVSACLRRYLLQRHGLPAPYRTSQELFGSAAGASATDVATIKRRDKAWEQLAAFSPLAQLWDRLAYAPDPTSPQNAQELVRVAIETLNQEVK